MLSKNVDLQMQNVKLEFNNRIKEIDDKLKRLDETLNQIQDFINRLISSTEEQQLEKVPSVEQYIKEQQALHPINPQPQQSSEIKSNLNI